MKKIYCYIIVLFFLLIGMNIKIVAQSAEITIWHMEQPPRRVKVFQEVIDDFNKNNPDINVKQQVLDWMDAYQKSIAAIQGGRAPEILFTLPDFTTTIIKTGAVRPVEDLIENLDVKFHFIDRAIKPYSFDGHIWAIPAYGLVDLMWYRKDLFKKVGLDPNKPPQTWNELLDVNKSFKENNMNGIGVPASLHMYTDQVIYSFMITAGAHELFDKEGNVIFNNQKTIKTFDFYKKLVEYSPLDSTAWSWAEPQLGFNNGTIPIVISMPAFLEQFEEISGVDADNAGCSFIPIADEDGQRGSIYYSNGMMILTNDEEKLVAIKKFLDYLFEPETYTKWILMEPGQFAPVTETIAPSYWLDPVVSKYKNAIELMIEECKNGRLFGFTQEDAVNENIGKISGQNILAQTVQRMAISGFSPEEAVAWGQAKMEEIIK
jgi:multiple sugar transport system substrate-binding protein